MGGKDDFKVGVVGAGFGGLTRKRAQERKIRKMAK